MAQDILGDLPTAAPVDILSGGGKPVGDILDQGAKAPKLLRGQEDAGVSPDADILGAVVARAKNAPWAMAGGGMEALGDEAQKTADLQKRGYGDVVLEAARKALRPGQAVGAVIGGLGDIATKVGQDLSGVDMTPTKEFGQNLSGAGAELGDTIREENRRATPTDLNMLQRAGLSAADSAIQMVPWLALGRGGVSRGLVSEGFVGAGALTQFGTGSFAQTYNDAKAHGASPDDAFKAAVISGGSEIITEKLGLDVLLKEGSKAFGKFLAREVGGEEVATIVQSLSEKGIYNPEKWGSAGEILGDLAETALGAGMGAGAIHGIDKYGLSKLEAVRKEEGVQDVAAAQEELRKAAGNALLASFGEAPTPMTTTLAMAPPDAGLPLTAAEEQTLTLEQAQRSGQVSQTPTPEAVVYAEKLDAAVARVKGEIPSMQAAADAATEELDKALDIGGNVSRETLARRAENANQYAAALPISQRAIVGTAGYGADQQVEGLTIAQLGRPPAGSVTAVEPAARPDGTALIPPEGVRLLTGVVADWVTKYMPDSRVVLNFEQMEEGSYGWHMSAGEDGGATHIINPMKADFMRYGGDAKSAMSLATSLSHEFGHALKAQSLYNGLARSIGQTVGADGVVTSPWRNANAVMEEIKTGTVSEETLARIPGKEQAMLRDWQTMRTRVLDGTMTAKEFMDSWVGTRKFGEDIAKTENAQQRYSWAVGQLKAAGMGAELDTKSALDLVHAVAGKKAKGVDAYLSLDEYMAEQFSRHAYVSGDITDGKFGTWFKDAMGKLKDMFRSLKVDGLIAPQVSFAEWLEDSTKFAQKRKMTARNKERSWKLSSELVAKREKVMGLKAEMAQAKKELEQEAKDAKAAAEKAASVKVQAKAKVQGKLTRTKADVAKAEVLVKVPEAEVPMMEYMQIVMQADTAQLKAMLRQHPARTEAQLIAAGSSAAEAQTYAVRRQMLLDAIAQKGSVVEDLAMPAAPVERTNAFSKALGSALGKEVPTAPAAKGKLGSKRVVKKAAAVEPDILEEEVPTTAPVEADILGEVEDETNADVVAADAETVRVGRKKGSWGKAALTTKITNDVEERQVQARAALDKWGLMLTEKQFDSISQLIDAGQLDAARTRISRVAEVEVNFDRDASSSAATTAKLEQDATEQLAEALLVVAPKEQVVESRTLNGEETQLVVYELPGQGLVQAQRRDVDARRFVEVSGLTQAAIMHEIASAHVVGKAELLFPIGEQNALLTRKYGARTVVDAAGLGWLSVTPAEHAGQWNRQNALHVEALPGTVSSAVAGLEGRTVREAVAQWKANGLLSPMFKRWFGSSKVRNYDGTPQGVWRVMGQRVSYLPGGESAFWFSDVPGVEYSPGAMRTKGDGNSQRVGQFYLRMENPLVWDAGGLVVDQKKFDDLAMEALMQGHDGVVLRNALTWDFADHFAVFDRGNAVSNAEVPGVQDAEHVHWDKDNASQVVRQVISGTKGYAKSLKISARIAAGWAALSDSLVQIQQRAHSNPGEEHLNNYAYLNSKIQEFKNGLQASADTFVKKNVQLFSRTNAEVITGLEKLLRYEATLNDTGEVNGQFGSPRFYDKRGNALNPNGERLTQAMLLSDGISVEVELDAASQASLAQWASEELGWTDASVQKFKDLVTNYTEARTIIAQQMLAYGTSMAKSSIERLSGKTLMLRKELGSIVDVVAPLIHQPVTPQGHFGRHVVIVKEKIPGVGFGQGAQYRTIRKEHFEDKQARDALYATWLSRAQFDDTLRVTQKEISQEEYDGLPLHLPLELMEKLAGMDMFTPDQLEVLGDMLVGSKLSSHAAKFHERSKVVEGSSTDLMRTFADFTWRNSNLIWKVHFKNQMMGVIRAAKKEVRDMQRAAHDDVLVSGQLQPTIDFKNRNIALMTNSMGYMLNPPNEYQALRMLITVLYLAYNVKTAVMNLSSGMLTWAAVTSRMGEISGNAAFVKASKNAVWLMRKGATTLDTLGEELTEEQKQLISLKERAQREGVIDQSYAYYLAAHANQNLAGSIGGKTSTAFHLAAEFGMGLFQHFEKFNRIASLLAFNEMLMKEGLSREEAYQEAVRMTGLLQNDYSAGNRPEIMRGGKALMTIFQSYAQYMGWVMTGGYERGERARARREGRAVPNALKGPTMRLWMLYLMLAGGMGVPFAQNIMDLISVIYRKFWGRNADADLREFIRSAGGDANYVLHGIMHNFFGADLSGSLGLGRLWPGTDTMTKSAKTAPEFFGNLLFTLTGVFGNTAKSGFEMFKAYGKDGSMVEALSKAPGATGFVSRAIDANMQQNLRPDQGAGVVTKGGARVVWDKDTKTFRDLTPAELGAMALGFNPAVRAAGMQKQFAISSEVTYWRERQADLMERHNRAKLAQDRETLTVVLRDIDEYNKEVPTPKMRITGAMRTRSFNTTRHHARDIERFGTTSKKLRGVASDVAEEY